MNEGSARDTVIELLEKLGNEDDAEVLSAARSLHAQVSEMGVSWDELLVQDDNSASQPVSYAGAGSAALDDDEEDAGDDEIVAAGAADDAAFDLVGAAADDIKRIEQIRAMKDISESLREELDGFVEDIKENEFTVADRQYLEALQQRLSKGDRKPK